MHRQQDNDQDEHAAGGGPDPGLVHALVAAGGTTRRLLHSRALASPFGFGRVTLTKAPEDARTEMPFVDDVDSPGVLLNVVKPWMSVCFQRAESRFAPNTSQRDGSVGRGLALLGETWD